MTTPAKWEEKLRQLPQLYKASKGDIEAIETFVHQLLSTLVKEMEGLKHTRMSCVCDTACLWNTGISAAVKIVKEMV